MLESARTHIAVVLVLAGVVACRERDAAVGSRPALAAAAGELPVCEGDSLRPSAAAPAPGLWVSEDSLRGRVAVLIGPPRSDAGALTVNRPVETMEVRPAGDTIRNRLAAATVRLELLPPPGTATLGETGADTTSSAQPAAVYAPSSLVRLAAYEPCATSARGPRVRYLRRDSLGRVLTDVMLRRTSGG